MAIGGLLAKAAIGSDIAKNGLVGTIKGVGDILAGIRTGVITVIQDFQKMTGNWTEPKNNDSRGKRSNVKGDEPSGK